MMKKTVSAFVFALAASAFANAVGEKPVDDDLPSGTFLEWELDKEKFLGTDTGRIARLEKKLERENLAAELLRTYRELRCKEPELERLGNEVAEERLTDVELAELSESTREYYEEKMSKLAKNLAEFQREYDELKKKLTPEDLAGYDVWKKAQAEEEVRREAELRQRDERARKAAKEIGQVRRKHRPERNRRGAAWWDRENVTDPEYCCREIEECDKRLAVERKRLAELERLTAERIAKLSPQAQDKYRALLDECKGNIAEKEARRKQLEGIRVENKWATLDEWKKQRAEKKKEERRKERQESLAREELRMALREAAESAQECDEDGRESFGCWF